MRIATGHVINIGMGGVRVLMDPIVRGGKPKKIFCTTPAQTPYIGAPVRLELEWNNWGDKLCTKIEIVERLEIDPHPCPCYETHCACYPPDPEIGP